MNEQDIVEVCRLLLQSDPLLTLGAIFNYSNSASPLEIFILGLKTSTLPNILDNIYHPNTSSKGSDSYDW